MIGKTWPVPPGPSGEGVATVIGPRNSRPDDEMWWVQFPNGEKRLVRETVIRRILEDRLPS